MITRTRLESPHPVRNEQRIAVRAALLVAGAVCAVLLAALLAWRPPQGVQASGCTLAWAAPTSGSWTDATKWTPARTPAASDEVCITQAGIYTVTLASSALANSLQIGSGATLDVQSASGNTTLSVSADVSNAGTLTLRQTGGGCTTPALTLGGTLLNSGTLNFGDACGNATLTGSLSNSGTVTVPGFHASKLNGSGATYANSGAFTLNGSLDVTAGTFVQGAGTLTVNSGGSLAVTGAGFAFNDGAITGTPVVSNGTLSFGPNNSGTGTIAVQGTSSLSGDVPAGATVQIQSLSGNTTVTAAAGFSNAGTISLTQIGGGCTSDTLALSSGTLLNSGMLQLGDACGGAFLSGSLHNTGVLTVPGFHASGFNGVGATYTNDGTFTVNGSLSVTAGTFIQNSGALSIGSTQQLVVTSPATLTLDGGSLGTPTLNGGQTDGAPSVRGSALTIGPGSTASGTVALEGNTTISGDVPAGLTVNIDSTSGAATATATGSFTNAGTISVRQTGFGCTGATLELAGNTLTNSGTLNLGDACGTATLDGSLVNSGTVNVPGFHAAALTGANATYTNSGLFAFGAANTTLQMSGAGASFSNSGTVQLAPGALISITNGGAFTNTSAGILAFDISSASAFGHISSTGTVTLAGTADPALQGGYTPPVGQRFQVITAPHGSSCFTLVEQGFGADCSNPASVALVAGANPLVASTTSLPSGTVGQPYPATTLAATGGTPPYSWALASGSSLPAGLSLSGGTIAGTPTVAGTTVVTFVATDFSTTVQTASATLSLTVAPAPLVIMTSSLPSGTVGQTYPSTALAAGGGTTPYTWTISGGSLPSGLSLSTGGSISGTPLQPGAATFTVQAGDSGSPAQATTAQLSITVTPAPLAVTTTSLPGGAVGQPYSAPTLAAGGGTTPYSWALASGSSLPPGLSLSPVGGISGTPTSPGAATFGVVATDSGSPAQVASTTLSITIAPATLTITTATLPGGTVGQAYPSTNLAAAGGILPYSWTLAGGSTLPQGLSLSAGGTISGTPTQAGTTAFTVNVTDEGSPAQTASAQLSIAIAPTAPTITTTSLPGGTVGQPYPSTTLAATGGTPPYGWTISSGSLPAGLSLSSTGAISGTPTAPGAASFTVKLTDSGSPAQTASAQLSIAIAPQAVAPGTVYVANGVDSNDLSVIDGGSNEVTGTIAAGVGAAFVAASPDASRLYVANLFGSSVSVVDTVGDRVIATIPVNSIRPAYIVVSPDGRKAYLSGDLFSSHLEALDTGTYQVTQVPSLQGFSIGASAFSHDGSRLFVPGYFGGGACPRLPCPASALSGSGIVVLDTTTNRQSGFIATVGIPAGVLVTRDGSRAYALIHADRSTKPAILAIDTATDKVTSTAPLSADESTFAMSPDGSRLYLLRTFPSVVVDVFDTAAGTVTGSITVQQARSGGWIAVGSDGTRLYVTLQFERQLAVIDTTSNSVITMVGVGSQPIGVVAIRRPDSTPRLAVATGSLQSGTAGKPYSASLVAAGGTAPFTWSISTGSLPAGLALNAATGVISGTPTAAGANSFTVTISDSGSSAQTASAQLSISVVGPPITIAPSTLPSAVRNRAYRAQLSASGGQGPYTFTVAGGALPAGLKLDQSGSLSGRPTQAGTFQFTVTTTDGNGNTGSRDYTLFVTPGG